jgi:hypothetical protein
MWGARYKTGSEFACDRLAGETERRAILSQTARGITDLRVTDFQRGRLLGRRWPSFIQ